MTKKNNPLETRDIEHEERVRRCAELGQIVRIDKAKSCRHYEGMPAELQHEAAANVNA